MPLGAFLCAFYCSPENNKSTLNCFRVDDCDLLKTFCNQYLGTGPHKIGTFYYKNHKEKPYTCIDKVCFLIIIGLTLFVTFVNAYL